MATFTPEHYLLRFTPDLKRFVFAGHTEITGTLAEPSDAISLDSLDLEVHWAEVWKDDVNAGGEPLTVTTAVDEAAQQLTLTLPHPVTGRVRIAIDYTGIHNDKLAGFYRASFTENGQTRFMAVTQFEETDARRAFPCIDRPAAKARFDVELVLDPDTVGIANTPIAWERELNEGESPGDAGTAQPGPHATTPPAGPPGGAGAAEPSPSSEKFRLIRFETTPPMSTYLLFFGVGPFEFYEDNSGRIPVRAAARPGQARYGKEAVEYAKESLRYGEQYTGIDFPIGKMDLIACPDFAFGAMENFGAISYRENRMLVHPEVTPKADRERVCQITCHEVAHMWFGNLVTPRDWSYIWLNEAFATYFGYVIADTFHPELDGLDQFVADQMDVAFRRDALIETVPVEFPDGRELEYSPATVPIVYRKAASILRMFRLYLGDAGIEEGVDGDALRVRASAEATGAAGAAGDATTGHSPGMRAPAEATRADSSGGAGSSDNDNGSGGAGPTGAGDSPALFRAGVREFLRRHAFGCADTDEFLRAFAAGVQAAAGRDGGSSADAAAGGSSTAAEERGSAFDERMLSRWIRTPGYPVVSAVHTGEELRLVQNRFTLLPNDDSALWPIPLTVLIIGADGSVEQRSVLFDTREHTLLLPPGTATVKLNAGQSGFYRVRYDDRTLESLAELASRRLLSPRDRFGLLYDLHAFVLAGEIELDRYLSLLDRQFAAEVEFLPVWQISRSLRELHSFATSTEERIAACGRTVLRSAIEAIGVRPKIGERHVVALLRESLHWTLYLLRDRAIGDELEGFADSVLTGSGQRSVPTDLRPVAYRVAAACRPASFETLCERLESAEVEEVEKQSIAIALGSFRDERSVERMLDYVADRLPARNRILPVAAAAANKAARAALWPWFQRAFDRLETMHPFHFLRILCDACAYGGIGRSSDVERFFDDLLQRRPETSRETVEMAKENLRVCERLYSRL